MSSISEFATAQMLEHGFEPGFSDAIDREVNALNETALAKAGSKARDLRDLLWSSVDNVESRDLDQLEHAELLPDRTIRLRIAIADVEALVRRDSATDERAALNTTSVYTGPVVFPMLPERLSTDLTSLNEGVDRLAVVTELDVALDGSIARSDVYAAWVHNYAKLDYGSVGAWLEGDAAAPAAIQANPELEQQLRWQDEAAQRLQAVREKAGALNIERIEARPVVAKGKVIDIEVVPTNRAREMIENFMVAANVAMAGFLTRHKVPAIRRVVRKPRRWDRMVEIAHEMGEHLPTEPDSQALAAFMERRRSLDADNFADLSLTVVKLMGSGEYVLDRVGDSDDVGHFGLAVAEYTHSTAPNRRFPDLVTQRMAKAILASTRIPYSDDELDALARHCTEQEDAANKVERSVRKRAAAELMQDRIGETFPAIVTGASDKGTYVRLLRPAVEGRLIAGTEGVDVGVTLRVRLARVDVERGYIDFESEAGARERKLERQKRKKAAAARLTGRIGATFDAQVTGASERGVYVRTSDGIEGRVIRGSRGLQVGETVSVKLVGADAVHGFIDFERITADIAHKNDRVQRKRHLAAQIQNRVGESFQAEVTGVSTRATWVRTDSGIEGRVVRGAKGLAPGDRTRVQLLAVDTHKGYIDFSREHGNE